MPLTLAPDATEWVTPAELRRHLRINSQDTDDQLLMVIGAAQDAVEGIIGPVLRREVTQDVEPRWDTIVLRVLPVLSITDITSSDTSIGYKADTVTGLVTGLSGYSPVRVTYVAGREVVPDAVRLATLIIAAHLWETQRENSPTPVDGNDFGQDVPFGLGFAIPNRAASLLEPFALAPAVA